MPRKSVIKKIKRSIEKRFPEYGKIEPEISKARIEPQKNIYQKLAMGLPKHRMTVYKMRYRKDVTTEDNVILKKILTVTFNEEGDILKITESK